MGKKSLLMFCMTAIACCAISTPCQGEEIDSAKVADAGLPVMYITTITGERPTFRTAKKENPDWIGNTITDEEKLPGRVYIQLKGETLYDSHEYIKDSTGMTIKVRGNTSALVSNKWPYKIKLQKKADLLCRGNDSIYKDKEWLLIRDENIRNMIGLKINELLKMQWTPAFRYVNVIMNGSYEGVYMLIESVKRKPKSRLDVSETGYIAEFDPYWWSESKYVESHLTWIPWLYMNYTFKYPDKDDITDEQLEYFAHFINKVEESLSDGTYSKYIDVESFARWMLARDILGNSDGAGSNIYLTKYDDTSDSKLMMGNLWDLEGSMKNEDKWDEVHNMGVFYYHDLFDVDSDDFLRMYKDIWRNDSAAIFEGILAFLNDYAQSEEAVAMNNSVALDKIRWDMDHDDIPHCIAHAQEWFTHRKEWLSTAMSTIKTSTEIEQERMELEKLERATTYYNLKGQKVKNPPTGVYIRQRHGQTIKVFK